MPLDTNTSDGFWALSFNTEGSFNTAVGTEALLSTTAASNTAVGQAALSSELAGNGNVAVGQTALFSDTSGEFNTGIGSGALYGNATGSRNSSFGFNGYVGARSGNDNTGVGYSLLGVTGSMNDATGVATLYFSSGDSNVAQGCAAMYEGNSGASNVALSCYALFFNSSGNSNTALGFEALVPIKTGDNNTAIGVFAIGDPNNFSLAGSNNVGLGYGPLRNLTSGSQNIGIGYNAGSAMTSGNNDIIIANPGVAAENNTIRIGTQGIQMNTALAGIFGTPVAGSPVVVNSSGRLGVAPSSRRFKEDIQNMGPISGTILALRPVTFRYTAQIDPAQRAQFGLVAEEVAKVSNDLVVRDVEGQIFTVRYDAVNAMLLDEFREQRQEEDEQGAALAKLQRQVANLAARDKDLSVLKTRLAAMVNATAR